MSFIQTQRELYLKIVINIDIKLIAITATTNQSFSLMHRVKG